MSNQPSAGAFVGREHRLPVRVYYEDTDFTGVVYHANYLRYFERGRSDFLRLAGADHSALLGIESPIAFVVTRMEIEFQRPARIDDALTVVTTYDAVRGARFTINQRLNRGDEAIAAAQVAVASIDLSGRPRRPPGELMARLQPFLVANG
ncbi:MAG: tol-pal system-associated acyl-CoA thioesterase [Caulobacterales bacterium 32-69-10]|nr:MAG: tol-pal system-associated acyl-CoA thioesterase [Caulobacterales bacterium 32-69-10]